MQSNFHFIQEKSDARGLHWAWKLEWPARPAQSQARQHQPRPRLICFLILHALFMLPVNTESVKINSEIKVVREMFP